LFCITTIFLQMKDIFLFYLCFISQKHSGYLYILKIKEIIKEANLRRVEIMNNKLLIIISFVLIIIAGVVTVLAFKQEEKKIETYKEQRQSPEEERKRSEEYEKNSVSDEIPLQIWAYVTTAIITVILIVIFMK